MSYSGAVCRPVLVLRLACGAMPTNLEAEREGERERGTSKFLSADNGAKMNNAIVSPFRRVARARTTLLSLCSTISFLGDELILIVVEMVYCV